MILPCFVSFISATSTVNRLFGPCPALCLHCARIDIDVMDSTRSTVVAQLVKTKMCISFSRGLCSSTTCRFAHSTDELRKPPDLQKTAICRAFLRGKCVENCKFAHGEDELRVSPNVYKTQLCNFFARGHCKKGDRCRHAHGWKELRNQESEKSPTSTSFLQAPPGLPPVPPVPPSDPSDPSVASPDAAPDADATQFPATVTPKKVGRARSPQSTPSPLSPPISPMKVSMSGDVAGSLCRGGLSKAGLELSESVLHDLHSTFQATLAAAPQQALIQELMRRRDFANSGSDSEGAYLARARRQRRGSCRGGQDSDANNKWGASSCGEIASSLVFFDVGNVHM
eukprot:s551_g17.t1